nr:hypothetical protein [uncultured Draconibacterium sp.]
MRNLTVTIFILLTICSINGHAQDETFWSKYVNTDIEKLNLDSFENDNFEKVYRIWKSYQVIELIKNDTAYSGQLVNFVTKTYRKTEKNKTIKDALVIPSSTVKTLFDDLNKSNIENLPDCEDVDGYASGLDGTTYIFEIHLIDSNRIYSYWEPMSDYYQNDSIKEGKDVRAIITTIDSMINPSLHFKNFTNSLDLGSYTYGGIKMIKLR